MNNGCPTGSMSKWGTLKSVAFIGNYLPRQCGIATFTTHLLESIVLNAPDKICWAIAMNDQPEGYLYPPPVRFEINQSQLNDYNLAADLLNLNQVDVVCLQHEFGIFGGKRGSFILELLRDLKIPVVTTLHTILNNPDPHDRYIMTQLTVLSAQLVVMSERSVEFLRDIYQVPQEKITLIPHGIPDVPFTESNSYKDRFSVVGKTVLLTFGLLSPGKGIEMVIEALPEIVQRYPQVVYMVVGATHPHLLAEQGEDYRNSLQLRAKELGVTDHVIFYDRFVSDEDLLKFIGVADIYVTPYVNEAQIISGTLAYALGMGKIVVSTPYWHAQELLAEGRGRLIPFRDHRALAREVVELLDHPDICQAIRQKAYQYGRNMIWSQAGRHYLDTFAAIKHRHLQHTAISQQETLRLRQQRLPVIKLDYLKRLTDSTGIVQHAKYTVPNRQHGYCVDDNARALMVVVSLQELQPLDTTLSELSATYLSFLGHSFNEQTGRFRNFMAYDRRWLESAGSEDSQARTLWALGVKAAAGRDKGQVDFAGQLFQRGLPASAEFNYPRSIAFTLIGLDIYLCQHNRDKQAKTHYKLLAERLMQRFRDFATSDWLWCTDCLTYDNARLPQALILAGQRLNNSDMLDMGLRCLGWLKQIQTDASDQHFSAIGNRGWFPKSSYETGGSKAKFDQQPIEAAAMVDACIAALNATQDEQWLTFAYRCLNWYQGENDSRIALYDPATGGCRDGLEAHGVNQNQGAESTLCWLMALLALCNHRGWNQTVAKKESTRLSVQPVEQI